MAKSLSIRETTKPRRWNLILARHARNITQVEVGTMLGYSKKSYGCVETGIRGIGKDKQMMLSDFFGIPLEQLMEIGERPQSFPKMKNKYEMRGDHVAILIKCGRESREALISANDLHKIIDIETTWYGHWSRNTYYCQGNIKDEFGKQRAFKLHRILMNAPDDRLVDHINHNTLDNRKENLRLATMMENKQNLLGAHKNSKTGVRGVSWDKSVNKYRAILRSNGKLTRLGSFDDINEAERAIISARKRLMPFSQEALAN